MADKELDRRAPFSIDEQALRNLDLILKDAAKLVTTETGDNCCPSYVIACSDRRSNIPLTIDELVNFPNYRAAKITRLEALLNRRYSHPIELSFIDKYTPIENIHGRVRGDDNFIRIYATRLEEWLDSTRKKYWIIYRFELAAILIVGVTISVTISSLLDSYAKIDLSSTPGFVISILLACVGSFLATWVLWRLMRIALPLGEFAIGRGLARKLQRERVLYTIIGTSVALGLLVGVAGNLVSALIVKP